MEDTVNQRQCLYSGGRGGLEMDKAAYLLAHDLNDEVRSLNLSDLDVKSSQTAINGDEEVRLRDLHSPSSSANTAATSVVRKRKKNSSSTDNNSPNLATESPESLPLSATEAASAAGTVSPTATIPASEKNSPVMQKVIKQDSSLLLESPTTSQHHDTTVVLVESFLVVPDSSVMGSSASDTAAATALKGKNHVHHLTSSCSFCGQTSARIEMLERAEAIEPPASSFGHRKLDSSLTSHQSFIRNISNRIRNRRRTTSLSELNKTPNRKLSCGSKMESHVESVRDVDAEISGGVSAAVASAVSVTAVDVDQAVPSPSRSGGGLRTSSKNRVMSMMINKLKTGYSNEAASSSNDFENFSNVSFFKQCNMVSDWFKNLNEDCKNSLLGMLLENCGQSQNHLLSLRISEPHFDCEPNCCDLISLLPKIVSRQVFSYLDPVSLARASQVNAYWYDLAGDSLLWKKFCQLPKWRFSTPSEVKQLKKFTDTDGIIDWKGVFAERFRVKRNWLSGKSTVKTFEGHEGAVSCVQFDDKRIVAGSSIGTIKVWNIAETGDSRPYLNLYGHSGIIRCLYLDGSLNRLYSGSADHSIKVWDLSDHPTWSRVTCKMTLLGHTDTVRCLQVNDTILISGSYDSTLKIWSLETGVCQNTLRGHTDSVLCLQFDHEKIVSGSADKTIRIWNFEGSCLQQLEGHSGAITCLHFDSQRIISGSLDFDIKFWRIDNGLCINTLNWITKEGHTAAIRCLKADSQKIVSCSDDKTIKIWNIETGERYVTLKNHSDGVTCLQFNDYYILSGSYDRTIKLWDFSAL